MGTYMDFEINNQYKEYEKIIFSDAFGMYISLFYSADRY